ncbi:hypothetical protein EVAR_48205_1 [Eumeta japonica]|uniref:Uncharacterized protein n=1 Tax=Eumeta variegata TaxID=151549 RepID=A0A4C1XX41_EUMVA|nr:hypothetical protein EVAR_48205_1 [Eumeta japonica]
MLLSCHRLKSPTAELPRRPANPPPAPPTSRSRRDVNSTSLVFDGANFAALPNNSEVVKSSLTCSRLSYSFGIAPDSWKTALVHPIPKKGEPSVSSQLYPLGLRRDVASLCRLYRIHYEECSKKLFYLIPNADFRQDSAHRHHQHHFDGWRYTIVRYMRSIVLHALGLSTTLDYYKGVFKKRVSSFLKGRKCTSDSAGNQNGGYDGSEQVLVYLPTDFNFVLLSGSRLPLVKSADRAATSASYTTDDRNSPTELLLQSSSESAAS